MLLASPTPARRGLKPYLEAFAVTAACAALAWLLDPYLETPNLALIFLTGVLLAAVRGGVGPAITASLASFLVLNVLFTDPRYTFLVQAERDVLTLGFFLLVALVTGQLAARASRHVEAARSTGGRMAALADFSRRLGGAVGRDDVARVLVEYLRTTLALNAIALFPDYAGTLAVTAGDPGGGLTEAEHDAARWAFEHREAAGRGADAHSDIAWWFVPLVGQAGVLGVIGVRPPNRRRTLDAADRQLLFAMRDQARTALERVNLAAAMERARLLTETDRLRTALLSSVSHDLRTPLVSIKGATTALLQLGDALKPADERELLENVLAETERLDRYVENVLDMTKLAYGSVAPRLEWRDIREIIGAARRALHSVLKARPVAIAIPAGDELIHTDATLLEQVLVNLIENAAKYGSADTPIELEGRRRPSEYELAVCDRGPGIPPTERERVFDMFARASSADRQASGTGIGLAICKGFVGALGGTICVTARGQAAGTCFRIRLPQPKELPMHGTVE